MTTTRGLGHNGAMPDARLPMTFPLRTLLCGALAAGIVLLSACAKGPTTEPQAAPAAAQAPADLEAVADAYIAQARALEPTTTPRLKTLAGERGGELYKLEYRFKSRGSLLRKLSKILTERPDLTLADVHIDDALRYTMLFPDEPPGNHNQAIHDTLETLSTEGHQVQMVKNYWPRGDGYSGVNSVLRGPNGLLWELQFQTPLSAETNGRTRSMYEELRKVNTPIARRRELFDQMTAFWENVPIPEGILEPGSLHEREQVRDRPRP